MQRGNMCLEMFIPELSLPTERNDGGSGHWPCMQREMAGESTYVTTVWLFQSLHICEIPPSRGGIGGFHPVPHPSLVSAGADPSLVPDARILRFAVRRTQ